MSVVTVDPMTDEKGSLLLDDNHYIKPKPFDPHMRNGPPAFKTRNHLMGNRSVSACEFFDGRNKSDVAIKPEFLVNKEQLLRLNIGGQSFLLRAKSVLRFGAKSLLGKFALSSDHDRAQMADMYLEDSKEYFFERSPKLFSSIYEFYNSGVIHMPSDACMKSVFIELMFWNIDFEHISECCSPLEDSESESDSEVEIDVFEGMFLASARRKIWNVTEGIHRSIWWKMYEFLSTLAVVVSITALILSSLPALQVVEDGYEGLMKNTSSIDPEEDDYIPMTEHPIFAYAEYVCVIYFTVEYSFRLLISPDKWMFVKKPLNIIDLLAILPFLIELALMVVGAGGDDSSFRQVRWMMLTVRVLRVLRVVRIAKLSRFSVGLRNFALTLSRSLKQLQMVAVLFMTCIVFFSTLIYFLEKDDRKGQFTSIPASFWWAMVTMTTVGYGDMVPKSIGGKLVGSATIVTGVMVLALPITIIVNNFMQVSRLNMVDLHTLADDKKSAILRDPNSKTSSKKVRESGPNAL